MNPSDRFARVESLYHAARDRTGAERDAFLEAACAGDVALRREVESLLAQPETGRGLLDMPPGADGQVSGFGTPNLTGRQFGAYEVRASIGAGGMGEVYRARDTKLGRDVAIKILPTAFSSDPDRRARFDREARVLASLNHPHIGAIYGVEESDGIRALVLEFVDGETLAERIARGPIPIAEALTIAQQITEAIDAAHEKGIVHRDLKPANIKITPDGIVKVLDFGLAKAAIGDGSGPDLTQSPTSSIGGTRDGVILGTAAYMSPEQARGKAIDKRTDVWAFGCVVYEMLTGHAAFAGDTLSDTIAAILEREPDWSVLRAETPVPIRRLLLRCLDKDAKRRLRDIGDARLELDARSESSAPSPVATARRRNERFAWLAAVGLLSLGAVAMTAWAIRPTVPPAEVHFDIDTPGVSDSLDLAALAVSPDGLSLAFVDALDGQPHVWVRSLDSVASRPLLGTAGASLPFWSADSRSVAFYADGWLKRIDLAGGLVRTLAKALFGFGGAWNGEGAILLVQSPGSPIVRTSPEGALTTPVTQLDGKQTGNAHPHFLPDGRHFLYFVQGIPELRGVYVGELDGPIRRKLFDADSAAVYASGHLLFVRRTTLYAQPFDLPRLEPIGEPFPVADDVTGSNLAGISAAAGGVIAFRTGSTSVDRQFAWFDRSGKEIRTVGDAKNEKLYPSASPDLGQIAFYSRVKGNVDVWLLETRRNVPSKFTDHVATDLFPVWSRDGSRIAFASDRNSQQGFGLYQKTVTGAEGSEELLLAAPEAGLPSDWSPDDKILLYQRDGDLWALPMIGDDRKPFAVTRTEFEEREGKFSSDGRWIAYVSDSSSGPFEVYVQPFPGPGQKVRVSTRGGAQVQWRADGKELFYIGLDGKLMAVRIDASPNGQSMTPGIPVPLFTTRVGRIIGQGSSASQYVVSGDGKRFLMSTIPHAGSPAPIRVIVNWKPR